MFLCVCPCLCVCVCLVWTSSHPTGVCLQDNGVVFQEQKGPDEIRAGFDLDKSSSLHKAGVPSALSPHSSEANVASVPMHVKSR